MHSSILTKVKHSLIASKIIYLLRKTTVSLNDFTRGLLNIHLRKAKKAAYILEKISHKTES